MTKTFMKINCISTLISILSKLFFNPLIDSSLSLISFFVIILLHLCSFLTIFNKKLGNGIPGMKLHLCLRYHTPHLSSKHLFYTLTQNTQPKIFKDEASIK